MILLFPILMGLLACLIRSRVGGRRLMPPDLCLIWLVPIAFLPQWVVFYQPATRALMPDNLIAASLVGSQLLLLSFVWFNRQTPGFWLLGLGLALNLLAVMLNGGLMPIDPETVAQLMPNVPADNWQVGNRLGATKDIILPIEAIRLWWLSDHFLLPSWFPYRAAFSIGDVLIAGGVFQLMWGLGGVKQGE
jgi:hypothetical protein